MHVWLPVIRTFSGTDVFSSRLCDALEKRGIKCTLTWFNRYYEFLPYLLSNSPAPEGTDIIHSNSWNGYAFQRSGIPMVTTEHLNVHDSAYLPYKSFLQKYYHQLLIKPFEKKSFLRADKITCVSRYTRESLQKTFRNIKADVISTWVDTDSFTNTSSRPKRGKTFNLLFVGNTTRRKGWDLVFSIMEKLGPEFTLYYTGSSSSERVRPNMISVGKIASQERMIELYNQCDAFLFPSRLEGLSQSVLEAMACGLPVVTSDSSSMPELIQSGENGILCAQESVEEYIQSLFYLSQNQEERERISRNARDSVVENFSETNVIPKYVSLYESLLDGLDSGNDYG